MADKDYGSILSRYLDPSETGFDTVVYQKGKPLLDSEFVLDQEIQNRGRAEILRQTTPSGWLTGDFNRDTNEDYDFRSESNTFYLVNKPFVNVNGWIIPVEYSNTSIAGENKIVLPSPPASTTEVAADFVYLEVWRALLAPQPSTVNKPSSNKIYRHGNVLSLSGEWLDDDLIDPAPEINTESTKRVQIQYRIVTKRLNSLQNRVGYTDSSISAKGPNSVFTGDNYSQMQGDPGLWRAGDGNPSNGLNTVDGYIYSVPICIIYRRNSAGFDFTANSNGGVLFSAGISDRPDGFFADGIVFDDVLDLRRHADLRGFNWSHVLERNTSMLMDQTLKTWAMNTAHTDWTFGGANDFGNRVLKADSLNEATPSGALDAAGQIFRSTDGRCRIFSDRAHVEQHIEVYRNTSGTDWTAGDTLSFDISADVPIPSPTGTVITDVRAILLDEGYVEVPVQTVTGLGTTTVTVTIDSPSVSSQRDIWVTYEITYPFGGGLNAHVDASAPNFQVNVHDPVAMNVYVGATLSGNTDVDRDLMRDYVWANYEDGPHREVGVYYTTDSSIAINVISKDATTIILPEYLYEDAAGTTKGIVQIVDTTSTPYSVSTTTSGRSVVLTDPLPSANEEVTVTYFPKRPIPAGVGGITLYYMTPGLQAVSFEDLQNADPDNTLSIEPVCISSHMFVGTAGSGSYVTPFPYEAPMNQIPVHVYLASVTSGPIYRGEHELNAPGDISIDDFDARTGFLRLPSLIPMAPVDNFDLKSPVDSALTNEFLDHYTEVDFTQYRPSAISQGLSTAIEHKCFLPIIARIKQDTAYGRKGEHVLVVFANYLETSEDNRIGFSDSSTNSTCAAIYRIKGNPVTY